jgi:hypothetical protein
MYVDDAQDDAPLKKRVRFLAVLQRKSPAGHAGRAKEKSPARADAQ